MCKISYIELQPKTQAHKDARKKNVLPCGHPYGPLCVSVIGGNSSGAIEIEIKLILEHKTMVESG